MTLVSNASPLIFLSKVQHLDLPRKLFPAPWYLPASVYIEVLPEGSTGDLTDALHRELAHWKIQRVKPVGKRIDRLSEADWHVLELARRTRATYVLVDDKLLRQTLFASGFHPIGTLGMMVHAVHRKVLTVAQGRIAIDALIAKHSFHIDAQTYQRSLQILKQTTSVDV